MTSRRVSLDKYQGSLVGGAIGDALGAPIEFESFEQIRTKYGERGIVDYVEFPDHTGAFTDDTQMTLFTAEALLRAEHRAMLKGIGGALPTIAYNSYLRWLYTQDHPFDDEQIVKDLEKLGEGWLIRQKGMYKRRAPGNTCLNSLRSGNEGSVQNPINNSKGCGTIMRMAPVGLMFYGEPEITFKIARDMSAITHGHPTGYLSAGFYAAVISGLAVGDTLEECINQSLDILGAANQNKETMEAVHGSLELVKRTSNSDEPSRAEWISQLGEGWVAEEALAISLFASLIHQNDFEQGVLYAVNHNGDSDSTGSITGNILGLLHGIDRIPGKWRRNLREVNLVEQIAEDLYIQVKGDSYHSDDTWWEKYPGY